MVNARGIWKVGSDDDKSIGEEREEVAKLDEQAKKRL
jgi:hypothetical protein